MLAEHRELTRIPNTILSGKAKVDVLKIPKDYTLGAGHVRFFYDKLEFLHNRYNQLHNECINRGFKVTYIWPSEVNSGNLKFKFLFKNWNVTVDAININRARIMERMPDKPRFTKGKT